MKLKVNKDKGVIFMALDSETPEETELLSQVYKHPIEVTFGWEEQEKLGRLLLTIEVGE